MELKKTACSSHVFEVVERKNFFVVTMQRLLEGTNRRHGCSLVVALVKQVAGTLLDNCAIRKRSAAFSPRAPARGTGEVSEEMDVVSPGVPRGGAREANGPS